MNPEQSTTPDEVLAEIADPLDALLRQVINGFFVLTDGQGAVSKWSEPAELLFAQPSEEILGQGFFETLVGGELPPAGQAWRGFLDAGEPPRVPGSVELIGRRSDGETFAMEAVFVPVKLDEGFDFSLFLEDLSFELPLNLMLMRMRQQHPVVVRALKVALEPVAQPWDGWRTAGTLVVFRPLTATPWVDAELARRIAERAAADAEAEERLTNPDPGIQGGLNDLDDAAAVVARLLSAMERIDELERVAGGLPAQLDEARRESTREGEALRGDLQRALSAVPSELDRHEAERRLARLERADEETLAAAEAAAARVAARLDALERDGAAADARLAAEISAAEARATDALSRVAGGGDVAAQLEEVRAEHEEAAHAIRSELAATVERLERDRERERSAARSELAAALERVEQAQRGADALREQLRAAVAEDRVDALAAAVETLRERATDLATTDQLAELRQSLGVDIAALREHVARHEASADEVTHLRAAVEAVRHAAPGDLAALREAVSRFEGTATEVAALRETVARHESSANELREAVARHESTATDVEALRQTAGELGALRETVARHDGDVAALRDAVAQRDGEVAALRDGAGDLDALREAVARQEAAASELAALREAVGGLEVLREAVARHESAAGEVAALRDAVAAHAAATAELASRAGAAADAGVVSELAARQHAAEAEVREAVARQDGIAAEVQQLRAQLSAAESFAGRAPDEVAVEQRVHAALGDTQRQLTELHVRLAGLDDSGQDLAALRARVDDLAERAGAVDFLAREDDLNALRGRVDELACRDDLHALHERLDAVPARNELAGLVDRDELDTLASRDDLAALRERLEALTQHDEITALRSRLDELATRDELAASLECLVARLDEVTGGDEAALRERLDGLATRDELLARLDGLATGDSHAEIAALREQLAGLARHDDLATLAGRDEVDALRERLGSFARHEDLGGLAGRDEVAALRELLQGLVGQDELSGLRERLESVVTHEDLATLGERIAQVDHGAGAVLTDVRGMRGELEVTRGQAAAAETEALGARQAAVAATEAANAAREDAAKATEDVAATRREVEAQGQRAALFNEQVTAARTDATAARAATEGLDARLGAIDQRASSLRGELDAVGGQVDRLGGTLVDTGVALRGEIHGVREGLDQLRSELAVVREESKRGENRMEAMQSELTYALKSLDELKQGLSSAGQAAVIARREAESARKAALQDGSTERVTEVFQQILGLAAQRNAQTRRPQPAIGATPRPEPSVRDPRHGFDDAHAPMAILALDGKFKELNPAFTKLVGYKEHEFQKAAWPSPHDRKDYKDQLEQLRRIGVGELRAIDVTSTYMHGQGLMVPVVGTLTLATEDDGTPSHLVLEAEERVTA